VSPFLDLGGLCGPPAERARSLPPAGRTRAAGCRAAAPAENQDLSVTRFAQLLALAILGLAGLLSLGVGGVVLVQGHAVTHLGDAIKK
jgi:hypothetical protein